MSGARIKLKLFIEGVEVDCVAAVIVSSINALSSATIQVPYTDALLGLEARSIVHLFFEDDGELRLLFAGEMVGNSYSKTPSGRVGILQCADFSTYWDSAKQYYAREDALFPSEMSKIAAFMGTDKVSYLPILESPGWDIVKALKTSPKSMPGVGGLLGGIIHVLERIGGIYQGNEVMSGLNIWFSHAELRLHLSQMLWASEKDNTSKKALKSSHHRKMIRQSVKTQGGVTSFRAIINTLLQTIFHEYSVVVAPILRQGGDTRTVTWKASGEYAAKQPASDDTLPERFVKYVKSRINTLNGYLRKGDSFDAGLPFVPAEEAEALKLAGKDPSAPDSAINNTTKLWAFAKDVLSRLIPDPVRKRVSGKNAGEIEAEFGGPVPTEPLNSVATGLSYEVATQEIAARKAPQPFQSSGVSRATWIGFVMRWWSDLVAEMQEALRWYMMVVDVPKKKRGRPAGSRSWTTKDRLMLFLFHPDLFWAAPPLCNVIFPDTTLSLKFSRSHLQEPTRLRLTTKSSWGGLDKFIDFNPLGTNRKVYVAPNLQDIHKGKVLGDVKRGSRVILPHEVYTGIVAAFEAVPYLNAFHDSGAEKDEKVHYLQRAANFLFYQKRMQSRTVTWTGTFSPYIVPGYPAVLLDRVGDADDPVVGQYIIKVMAVQHSINTQGQASSSIQGSHARLHNERGTMMEKHTKTIQPSGGEVEEAPDLETIKEQVAGRAPMTLNAGVAQGGIELLSRRVAKVWLDFALKSRRAAGYIIDDHAKVMTEIPYGKEGTVEAQGIVKNNVKERQPQWKMWVKEVAAFLYTGWTESRDEYKLLTDYIGLIHPYLEVDKSRFQQLSKLGASYTNTQGFCENKRDSWTEVTYDNATTLYNKVDDLIALIEEFLGVEKGKSRRTKVWYTPVDNVPLEDILKPPWAAEIYDKDKIGDVYRESLGSASIMDLGEDLETIEAAVENIMDLYRQARNGGPESIRKFIQTLTRRPAVTLDRMLGQNGFHRASFGDYRQASTGIAGIDKILSMTGLTEGDPSSISKIVEVGKSILDGDVETLAAALADPALDPRPARRSAARKYADSLRFRSFYGG